MTTIARCGFTYDAAVRRKTDAATVAMLRARNRVPQEGLDLMAAGIFTGGAIPSALFIGLWSGSHAPDGAETAANLLTLVTEITSYEGAARPAFTPGAVAAGGVSNVDALARFNFNANAMVNGAFISTASAKGASSGRLLSVVRFPNARAVDASVYLEVLSGFQFLSM